MPEEVQLFVPGRLCLFGEHSDWAAGYRRVDESIEPGYAIVTGTNQGIYAKVRPHPDRFILRSTLPDGTRTKPFDVPMEERALREAASRGDFFSYAAGVAHEILVEHRVRGIEIDNYRTDLPMKKGLSSSAAICVLVARAFNRLYELRMTIRGEMEKAYRGEILTPSRCGRLDQACAYGNRPTLLTFDGENILVETITPGADLFLVVVDLKAGKDTLRILADLNACYPNAEGPVPEAVRRYLGAENREIVRQAREAIERGDLRAVGALMDRAQAAFDRAMIPACPRELEAPVLHRVLADPRIRPHVLGGKGVGSQGDGCAQFLVEDEEAQDRVVEILWTELGLEGLKIRIPAGRRVRKAVIPAAGSGTRLYPVTKGVQKEMFPVVDRTGVVKPVLQIIIEEALESGIEEICIITRPGDEEDLLRYFQSPIDGSGDLSPAAREQFDRLPEIGRRLTFIVQERQEGFGHAVLTAREWVGDEPFLLMLGDHVYVSESQVPCARQLLDMYERHQANTLAVQRTPEERIEQFGTVSVERSEADPAIHRVTRFAEKPTIDYAREYLRCEELGPGEYYTIFGQYVLNASIFEVLEEMVRTDRREGGEFQLTTALDEIRRREGFLAYETQGRRYDTGHPEGYIEAVNAFRIVPPHRLEVARE